MKLVILAILITSASQATEPSSQSMNKLTDLAALHTQEFSIKKLQTLLKQYRGSPREPELLSRLADLYLQRSGITFRVSEGIKDGMGGKPKTALYVNSLKDSIRVFSELISKYPTHSHSVYARYKRGKAYRELNQIKEAREDFLYLSQHNPEFEYIDSALLDLADFAADANHHQEALTYLGEIEKMKGSDFYPVALHRSAWSHFNLGNHATALDYLKKEAAFYFSKKDINSAEIAFLETVFNDAALFYFEAINKKADFATVDHAITYFKKLDQKAYYGPTVFKFAKLLKAYSLLPELEHLKDRLVDDDIRLPETAEVALLIFQYQFEKRNFKPLESLMGDLGKIKKAHKNPEIDQRIETTLTTALDELHKLVLKNKLATERMVLVKPLISLTDGVADLLGSDNTTTLVAQYSLAETSFELQDYERATQKYLELMNPKYVPMLESKKVTPQILSLRLISSRYRELKALNLISEKLTIRSLSETTAALPKEQQKKVEEWVGWVDFHEQYVTKTSSAEDRESYEAFALEADKLVYEHVNIPQALVRLEKFAFDHSDSKQGVTAVTINLDTYSKSEDWNKLYELSIKITKGKKWKDKAFVEKVYELGADAHLKLTLKLDLSDSPEQIALVKSRTASCIEEFANSKVAQECAFIQAKLELKHGSVEKAEKDLGQLILKTKDTSRIESILLLRADARNKLGKFDEAIKDLSQYQNLTEYQDADVTQTILQHYWFKRDDKNLSALTQNKKVCSGKNAEICERYQAVQVLSEKRPTKMSYQAIFKNSVHAPKSLAAVWALAALKEPKKVPFNDRLVLLQRVANSWEDLNPLLQIHLLSLMQIRVNDALESIRTSSSGIAPLTSDPNSIVRRMTLTKEVDTTFAKVMKLPWFTIKMKGATELGVIYQRLVEDLRKIQTPEDLLKPFIVKGAEVNQAITNLKEMAKNFNTTQPEAIAAGGKPVDRKITSDHPTVLATTEVKSTDLLVSKEIQNLIPTQLWGEWTEGVKEQKSDYLFYLLTLIESTKPEFKTVSPVLRGLVLLIGNAAPTEAYELVKAAPNTPLQADVLARFQSP